ncbi:unnamed protein product [Phytomonas sp. Hart1]|nr:unnamed protein product [Phytomonas sp. Hart1]|eukprot:CCW68101.1 unnamed protein product [Phytomonas sp. isolate Hart1]
MSQGDFSTALLVDHMNEIDKRRRMMTITQKEVETKLALATNDSRDLRKTADAMTAEEEDLKRVLDALTEEQRKVDLQLVEERTRARQCEAEEPLLHAHTTEQLGILDHELDDWRAKSEKLEELWQAFSADEVLSDLRETIRQLEEDLQAKKQEKEKMEKETSEFIVEIARLRDPLYNRTCSETNCLPLGCDPAKEIVEEMDIPTQHAIQELEQLIQQEKLKFEQTELQHHRQRAILQTETEDLEMRAGELLSVLQDVNNSREHLENSLQWLYRCLEYKMCLNCMQSYELKNS